MSPSFMTGSWRALLLTLSSAGAVVAVGAALSAVLCQRAATASSWLSAGWAIVGPWLATALSLCAGRDARPPLSALPALALLGAMFSLMPLPVLHRGLLGFTLLAWVTVAGASISRSYTLRLASSLACGAAIAALHVFAVLCQAPPT